MRFRNIYYRFGISKVLSIALIISILISPFSPLLPTIAEAAAGVPKILSYQGRLTDENGNLLGGSGAPAYFKFSLWNSPTVPGGTQLWPSSAPGTVTTTIRQGVFNVNIGDTANGYPNTLDYDFGTNDTIYLQIEVSDDNVTFETLAPRQLITASTFAELARSVRGTDSSTFGTTTVLNNSVVSIQATSTNAVGLTIQAALGQAAHLFRIQSSTGNPLFYVNQNGGLFGSSTLQITGDTTLYSNLAVGGHVTSSTFTATSTTATSTFPLLAATQSNVGTVVGGTWQGSTIAADFGGTGLSTITQNQLLIGGPGNTIIQIATSTLGINLADTLGTLNAIRGGTGQTVYAVGDLLYADTTTSLTRLARGSNGTVLKISGGVPTWGSDLTSGGGGAGAWATSSDSLSIYPSDTGYVVLIGTSATTTTGNIFEVVGNSKFGGNVSITGNLNLTGSTTLANLIAINATTTNATSTTFRTTVLGVGSEYITDITGAGLTISGGALTVDTSGNWTGTFDGADGTYYLANSYSTTSADYWLTTKSTNNLAEGVNNLYYTPTRVNDFIQGSSTIPKTYTANTFSNTNTFSGAGIFNGGLTVGTLHGPLQANAGVVSATSSIGVLYGGTGLTSAPNLGQILVGNSLGGYTLTATSSLGLPTSAITSLNGLTNSTQTFATTSDTNIGLNIVSSGSTHTFTPTWSGTLAATRGGTGLSTITQNQLLIGGPGNTITQVATTSLGLITTTIPEGTNLYYTDARVNSYIHASTTIPKLYTSNTFTNTNTFSGSSIFNGGVTIGSLNGPLQANAGVVTATTSIGVLYGGTGLTSAPNFGEILRGNGSGGYTLVATSTLGIAIADTTGTLAATRGGTGLSTITNNQLLIGGLGNTITQVATTSLGLITTTIPEGTNLYYTDARVNSYIHSSTTIPKLYTSNMFTNTNTFLGSSILNGGLTISTLNGPLQANAGVVTATTSIGVLYGGTGWTNILANSILLGNGTGALATTSAGTDGFVLALVSGVPTWQATTTLSTISGTLAATKGGTGLSTITNNQLLIGGAGNTITQVATTSLGLITTTIPEGTNLYYTDARVNSYIHGSTTIPKLYTANTFTNTNTFSGASIFNGGVTIGVLNGPLDARNGVVGATTSIGVLYGGTGLTSAPNFGEILRGNGTGGYTLVATSTLGIAIGDTTGTLAATRGGTGLSTITNNQLLIGGAGNTITQIATTSLGLITTTIPEGTNLYYTDARVNAYINGSTTIPKLYTSNTFTNTNTFSGPSIFNGGVTIGALNGPLQANAGVVSATTSIGVLYGGTGLSTAPTYGQLLLGNALGGYTLTATSSLGLVTTAITSLGAEFSPALTAASQTFATSTDTNIGLTITSSGSTHTFTPTWTGTLADARVANDLTISGGTINNTPIGASSASTAIFTNATSSNATSTNLAVSGSFNVIGQTGCAQFSTGGLLTGTGSNCGSGSGSGSDTNWTFFNGSGIRLATTTNQVLVGASATTSLAALEVIGNSYISGNVGIGTTSPYAKLSVVGEIVGAYFTATTTATSTFPRFTATQSNVGTVVGGIWQGDTIGVAFGGTGLNATPSFGQILRGNGSGGYELVATSTLGIALADTTGILPATRGGTGLSTITNNQLLIGGAGNTITQVATTSLGLITTTIPEGTNLYYTDARVNAYIHASTTIPKLYTTNTFTNTNTFSGSSIFNGGVTIGVLNGPLQANAGVVSATTSIGVLYGGTGLTSAPNFGEILRGNDTGGYSLVATSTLGIAIADTTGTLAATRGGTGLSTITNNQLLIGGLGNTITQVATTSLGLITTTIPEGTNLYHTDARVNTFIHGSTTIPKTYTNNTFSGNNIFNGTLTIGALNGPLDARNGVVGATTSIGVLYGGTGWTNIQANSILLGNGTGALATTSAGTDGFVLALVSGVPTWQATTTLATISGTLAATKGGTGLSTITNNQLLIGGAGNTITQVATTSLGLITTTIPEGTNLYYTDARVNSYIHASTTIPKLYTANTFTNTNTFSGSSIFNGGVTIGALNGPIQANAGVVSATSSIGVLYGGTGLTSAPNFGEILRGNGTGGYTLVATSTLGIAIADTTGTLAATRGGTGLSTITNNQLLIGGAGNTITQVATTSLGLITTTIPEGTNLYYTDARVNSYIHGSTTIPKTYTANTFTNTNTFSGSSIFNGGVTIGALNGPLDARNGVVGATTSIGVLYGGTGWNNIQANSILLGNGIGALATTSAGTDGFVLALVSGVPTWQATTTLATISGTLAATKGGTGLSTITNNQLLIGGAGNTITQVATTSLGLITTTIPEGTNLYYTDARVNAYIHGSTTIPKLYTTNTFTNTNTFSGSSIFNGGVTIGSLNGPLQANAGVVSATTSIGVLYGGTGWSNILSNSILLGNGTGALATTSVGTDGFVLALVSGVPTWQATTTLATISGTLAATKGGTGLSTITNNQLLIGGAGNTITQVATTSLGLITTTIPEGTNLYYTDARVNSYIHASTTIPKLYTANTFTDTNTFSGSSIFNGSVTIGALNGPLDARNGVVGATTSIGVLYGGTGATSFGQGWLYSTGGTSVLAASTSPTVNYLVATSTTATSTFAWGVQANALNIISSNASSTFANGINLTGGCFAISGACVGGSGGSGTVNTGIFGQLAFYGANGTAVSGTTTIVIGTTTANANNIGIGTSSPYAKLSVQGTLLQTNPVFEVASSSNSVKFLTVAGDGFGTTTLSGLTISGSATSTSNVGINLTGGCFAISGACVGGSGGSGTVSSGTTGQFAYYSADGTAVVGTSTLFTSTASKIGIGTTTPYAKLSVASGIVPQLLLTDTSAGSNLKHWYASSTAGSLTFGTLSDNLATLTEYMRINSSGNVGIGTTSPYAKLSVVGEIVGRNITATSTTATSTFAGGLDVSNGALRHDFSSGLTSIDNLALGATTFDSDGGILSWIDMPVTSSAVASTVQSYSAQIDGNPLLTVYAQSDGSGGIQNSGIAIGTSSPTSKLTVWGGLTGSIFNVVTSASTTALSVSATGFGTTTLSGLTISGSATSTSNVGLNITGGCYAISNTCIGGSGGSGTVNTGVFGQLAFYGANGTAVSGTTTIVIGTTTANANNVGIGTTSPYAKLSVQGNLLQTNPVFEVASSSNAVKFLSVAGNGFGTTTLSGLNIDASATSTSDVGFNITTGCYAVNGTCISGGGSGDAGFGVEAVRVHTVNGTWTKPAFVNNVYVEVWGGGGGGGVAGANNSDGGGGGGGYAAGVVAVNANVTVTIGATSTVGANGNASSFAASGGTLTGGAGQTNSGTTGGAGGTASGGTITVPGQAGGSTLGAAAGDGAAGGNGGGAPFGGAGGMGGTAVATGGTGAAGQAGAIPGGGGGGGSESAGAASAGARGMVLVWELSGTNGSDLAEMYETKEDVEVGDIVSISKDSFNYDSEWGLQKISILEKAGPDSKVVGVVSTAPAITMGRKISESVDAKNPQPIALAGRTPVKVSLENGPIKAGDLLGPSSIPGVAAKMEKSGIIIGAALEDYISPADGATSTGKVMMFVQTQYSSGARTNVLLERAGIDSDNIPAGLDIGRIMLAQLMVEKKNITASSSISEVFTDRVVAGLELITPRVLTDTLVVNTIEAVEDDIKLKLAQGGKMIITKAGKEDMSATFKDASASSTPVITFDADGNAVFAGTVTANKVVAKQIEGLEIFTDSISSLTDRLESLATSTASSSMSVSAQLASVFGFVNETKALLASSSEHYVNLASSLAALETQIASSTPIGKALTINRATIWDGLEVDSIGTGGEMLAFQSDLIFIGRPYFTTDTAGFALIKKGAKFADVTFGREYLEQPIINASISLENASSTDEALEDALFGNDIRHLISKKTTHGFRITLNKAAPEDITFSWIALAVKGAKTSTSTEAVVVPPPPPVEQPVVEEKPPAEEPKEEPKEEITEEPAKEELPVEEVDNEATEPEVQPTEPVVEITDVPAATVSE
ncbi:hypothetical protein KW782_01470 [Candidatus Parcubacteria bacterium]|nr:hypothetical protein [Candidatus Parcubacteria bacterium]